MAGLEQDFAGEAWAAEGASVGYPAAGAGARPDQGRARQRHGGARPRPRRCSTASRRSAPALARISRRRDGGADRRAGRAAGEDRRRRRLGPRTARSRSRWTRCAARPATRDVSNALGRRAAPGGAVPPAAATARPAAARRADQPSRRRDRSPGCERFLQDYPGTVVTVTHDRYFLDKVAGWILELDRGHGIPCEGNYSGWLEQKQKRLGQEGKQESGPPAHPASANSNGCDRARAPARRRARRASPPMRRWSRESRGKRPGDGADRHAAGAAPRRSGDRGASVSARALATGC